ncbi:MAG: acetamidase/formamidase family protein [Planctomycetota bacterium]
MRRTDPDVIYSHNSAANPVTFTVEPGEVFQVDTVPTCGRKFDTHTGREDPKAQGGVNASTGCIAIEGAKAGQVAVVHVLDIELHEYGFTRLAFPSPVVPELAGRVQWEEQYKPVRIRDGYVEWSEDLQIPAAPMVGYVGLARPNQVLSHAHNGQFGGNFDAQEITAGARVHLPVTVDGGLLHVGDVHAVQGDGEIDCAGGIETAALLTLKVELAERPKRFGNPRIETDGFIATTGFARPAEAAFRQALTDLIFWMTDEFGFSPHGAHMLLAQVLQARVTQFVNPLYTYLCKVQRKYLVP